ncbi:hypothetical protein ACH5RR_024941 [Cinchona calisaya]|uniref:Bifunctional inhibitor/plant lipid transfer protein/seed storage helical domain-containing protein n=1 Tax=Cinchona calisaya TaxID=153742 RepID=A0ABD2YZ98_9GENT
MKAFSCIAIFAVLMLLLAEANVSKAVTCNPTELNPCAEAIAKSASPTSLCCNKIKEQKPCLCQIAKMKATSIAVYAVLVLLLAHQAQVFSKAPPPPPPVNCDPSKLTPCTTATSSGVSEQCCTNLKEQLPCICIYVKQYGNFLNIPAVQSIFKACKITIPKCP